MNRQSSPERSSKFRKSPIISERGFILIFIAFFERVLNATISSDISSLIIDYMEPIIRLDFNESKSRGIAAVEEDDIELNAYTGCNTVLFADGELLDRSRGTKYEVVFRINKMKYAPYIGYVFGSIQAVDFERRLGFGPNKENSMAICVGENAFYLCDKNHCHEPLEREFTDELSTFPKQGQIWRVSWDLIDNEMEISVLNQQETDWISMTHYAMEKQHQHIIPAINMSVRGDSIVLL